jgi:hypothetical protein
MGEDRPAESEVDFDADEPTKCYVDYEVVSVGMIADGWHAVYVNRPPLTEGQPAFWEEPLIGFALYEVTRRPYPTGEPARKLPREIHGVVDCGGYFGPPHELGNFWFYRSPRQPLPTNVELAEELARRGW